MQRRVAAWFMAILFVPMVILLVHNIVMIFRLT